MNDHPILFCAPMVRTVLSGVKTQTRRQVNPQPHPDFPLAAIKCHWYEPARIRRGQIEPGPEVFGFADEETGWRCPYGAPGDRLWVRETFAPNPYVPGDYIYRATESDPDRYISGSNKWKPSIFMPRRASRITLEITAVRVERLQKITDTDARAEGINISVTHPSPTGIPGFFAKRYVYESECFADLWRLINGHKSWDANPYVWVLKFRRL